LGSLQAVTLAAIRVAVAVMDRTLYGVLAMLLTLVQSHLELPVYLSFLAVSLVCGLAGAILLIRFFRRFPLQIALGNK
jgi:hypothetical protein